MDTKSLLKLLVETESPSRDKDAVNKVASIVIDEAKKLGANVEVIENAETGNHIISKWGSGKNNILFNYSIHSLRKADRLRNASQIIFH